MLPCNTIVVKFLSTVLLILKTGQLEFNDLVVCAENAEAIAGAKRNVNKRRIETRKFQKQTHGKRRRPRVHRLPIRVRYTIHENVVYRVSCTVYRVFRYIHDHKRLIHDTYTKNLADYFHLYDVAIILTPLMLASSSSSN